MKKSLALGTMEDDFLFTGTRKQSLVYGWDGNDLIEDKTTAGVIDTGKDWLFGNYGDDLLITHAGRDTLGGGDDNDFLAVDKQLGDIKTVTLKGGSGDNTAIIVTNDPRFEDFDPTAKDQVLDMGDYDVKLHRVQHVDFMTADEFAAFTAAWEM